jgi:Proteolysis_6 C-terminal
MDGYPSVRGDLTPLTEYSSYPFFSQVVDIVSNETDEILNQFLNRDGASKQSGILFLPDIVLRDLLWRWLLFIDHSLNIYSHLCESSKIDEVGLLSCQSPKSLTNSLLEERLIRIGLIIKENIAPTDDFVSQVKPRLYLSNDAEVCVMLLRSWMIDIKKIPSGVFGRNAITIVVDICRNIMSQKYIKDTYIPHLMTDLPESYTQLHSLISSKNVYDRPCICLVCGALFDVKIPGSCAKHMPFCSGDIGVFFLVQVSSIHLNMDNLNTHSPYYSRNVPY